MTRVAAGHPAIWPDVCADNRDAIVAALASLRGRLATALETASRRRTARRSSRAVARPAPRGATCPSLDARPERAGRAPRPGPGPARRPRGGHDRGQRGRASTSTTSRSPTPPRATVGVLVLGGRRRRLARAPAACSGPGPTAPRPGPRVRRRPTGPLAVRGGRPRRGDAGCGPGRQVDLPPGPALAGLAEGTSRSPGLSDGDDVARTRAPPSRALGAAGGPGGPGESPSRAGGDRLRPPPGRSTCGNSAPACGCWPAWWPAWTVPTG